MRETVVLNNNIVEGGILIKLKIHSNIINFIFVEYCSL